MTPLAMPNMTRRTRSVSLLALAGTALLAACDESRVVYPCPEPARLLTPAHDTILVGETIQFTISQDHGKLTWNSTKKLVASVNQAGVATALASGTATISATDSESPANCPAQWYAQLEVR